MLPEELRAPYTKLEELRREVLSSPIWRAIEQHVLVEGSKNALVDFPLESKLYVRGGEIGISLRKVSPYAKVVLSEHPLVMGHALDFRAEVHLTFIHEDEEAWDNPRQYERETEIAVPYAFLEPFSPALFEEWITLLRSKKEEDSFKELQKHIGRFVARYPHGLARVISHVKELG